MVSGDGTVLSGGGTLSGVTLGDATRQSFTSAGNVFISGGLTLASGLVANIGSGQWLFQGGGTTSLSSASGNATVNVAGGNIFAGFGAPQTLNIGSGITIQGRGGLTQSSVATINNAGTIVANVAGQSLTISPNVFNNTGTLSVLAGSTISTGNLSITSNGTIINGGTISVGSGTLTSNGIFSPGASPGFSVITGNLVLGAGSTLNIEIGGYGRGIATGYDAIHVTGNVTLGGTVNVLQVGGFVATVGDAFHIVSAGGTRSGTFATVFPPSGLEPYALGVDSKNAFLQRGTVFTGVNVWNTDSSGNFNLGSNWSTGVVPTAGDTVLIDRGPSANPVITVNSAISVGRVLATEGLTVSGGSLDIAGPSSISGPLTLSGGTLTLGGATAVSGTFTQTGGTLGGTGNLTLSGALNTWSAGTIGGGGTLTIANGATLNMNSGANKFLGSRTIAINPTGALILSGGQVLNQATNTVNNAGLFDIQGNDNWINNTGGPTTFNNLAGASITRSSGSGSAGFSVALNNAGSVNVQTGTLALDQGGIDTGSYNISSPATLQLSGGTRNLNSGAAINGAGNITFNGGTTNLNSGATDGLSGATTISGGTVNFNDNFTLPLLTLSTGTLGGTGNLTLSGALNTWSAGTIGGGGTLTIANGATLNMNSGANKFLGSRTIAINPTGALILSGGQVLNQATNTVNNAGLFDIQGNDNWINNTGGPTTFNNLAGASITRSSGSGSAGFSVALNNAGSVNVQTGTLTILSSSTNSGVIDITAGTTFDTGGTAMTNAVTGTINGAGTLNLGSATLTNNGILAPGDGVNGTGTLTITGNLTQGGTGQMNMQLAGTGAGQFDKIAVSGTANLGGTLNMSTVGAYTGNAGDSFQLLTYGASVGTFAAVNPPSGLGGTPTYNASDFFLALSLSGSCAVDDCWIGTSGDWSVGANWSTGAAPTTGQRVRISVAGTQTVTMTSGAFSLLNIDSDENLTLSGGTLSTSGLFSMNAGTTLGISGGALTVNGTMTAPRLNFSSGTLGGAGSLTLNGASTWSGGTVTLAGLNVPATSTLAIAGSGVTKTLGGGGVVNNAGTVNWNAGQLNVNGVFNNQSGGVFNALVTGGLDDLGGAGTYNNLSGAIYNNNAASGNSSVGVANFNNAGRFKMVSGITDYYNTTFTNTGNIDIASGATLKTDPGFAATVNINAGSTLTGAGQWQINNNDNVNINTVLSTPSGMGIAQTGGTLNVAANLNVLGTYALSGGTLSGSGNFTVTNAYTRSGGNINTSGNLSITQTSGNLSLGQITAGSISATAPAGSLSVNGALVSPGDITLAAQGAASDITVSNTITGTGVAGKTLTLQANNNVIVSAGAAVSSANALNVVLNSDRDASGAGNIQVGVGASLATAGGNATLGGGTTPATGYARGTGGSLPAASGIYIDGSVNAGSGNLTLHGQGAATAGDGITFNGGTLSGNGTLLIDGITSANGTLVDAHSFVAGVRFANAGTRLTTSGGSVNVTGVSTGSGLRTPGILVDTATIETTGSGALTLNGTSSSLNSDWGVGIYSSAIVRTTAPGGGRLTVNGRSLSADSGTYIYNSDVTSGGGEIRITGQSAGGESVGIWHATIGGPASGNILLQALGGGTAPIDLGSVGGLGSSVNAGSSTLTILLSGQTANDSSDPLNAITAGNLRLLGSGTFNLGSSNNNVATLSANVSGSITYRDSNALAIGSVTSFDGAATTSTSGATVGTLNINAGGGASTVTVNAGATLAAAGTITGNLLNLGTVSPGGGAVAALNVTGNFTQTSGGALDFQVAGTTAGTFDKLAVTGSATLDGAMAVATASGFVPVAGQSFGLVTYGSSSGSFAAINAPAFTGLTANYGAAGVTFTVPGTCAVDDCWIGTSGDWSVGSNWSTGFAPTAGQRVRIHVAGLQTITMSAGGLPVLSIDSDENFNFTGGALTVSGAFNMNAGTTLGIAGGALTLNGALAAPIVNLSSGSLGGPGNITVGTDFNQTGGTFNPSGNIDLTRSLGNLSLGALTSNGTMRLVTTGLNDISLNGSLQATNVGLADTAPAISVTSGRDISLASTTNLTSVSSGAINLNAAAGINLKVNDGGANANTNTLGAAGNLDITAGYAIVRTDGNPVRGLGKAIGVRFATLLDPAISFVPSVSLSITKTLGDLDANSLSVPALFFSAPAGNIVFAPGSTFGGGLVTVSGSGSAIFNSGAVTFNSGLSSSIPLAIGGALVAFNAATSAPALSMGSGAATFAQTPLLPTVTLSGGNMTISGDAAQTISGGVWDVQSGGVLTLPAAGALVAAGAALHVNGGSVNYGANLQVAGTLGLSSGTLAGVGNIDLSGTLNKTGAGTFTLTNALNDTGSVNVAAGTLSLTGGGTDSGVFSAANGATIDFQGGSHNFADGAVLSGTGTFDGGGILTKTGTGTGLQFALGTTINLNALALGGTGKLTNLGSVSGNNITLPGDFINQAGGSANFTGVTIGGSLYNHGNFTTGGLVTVAGAQLQQLGGVLTVPGGTTLNMSNPAGVFSWINGTIAGAGTLGFSGGGTFLFAGTGDRVIDGLNFAFTDLTLPDGSLTLQSGSLTLSGATVLPAGVALNLHGGTLNNNGTLNVAGSFGLTGGAFGGTGSLTMSGGSLSLPAGNSVAWTNSGVLTNTGTLDLADSTITNAINNQGTINLGGGLTFTQGLTNTGTVDANAGSAVFSGGLVQNAGNIVLNGGSLQGNVSLNAGSIKGGGTVNGNLVVGNATIAPGFSPGAITVTGNLNLGAASVLNIELGGLAPSSGYDFVDVRGSAVLNGTLNVKSYGGFVPPPGSNFTFMKYGVSSGAFSGVNLLPGLVFTPLPSSLNLSVPVVAIPPAPPLPPPGPDPISVAIQRIISGDDLLAALAPVRRRGDPEVKKEIEVEGCR